MPEARTDRHNNPIAFTTDIAKQAGLELGVDYEVGDAFVTGVEASGNEHTYHTARLLKDPIWLCIRVIDKLGFFTKTGVPRWAYIQVTYEVWQLLPLEVKKNVLRLMYHHEGGSKLEHLFK